MAKKMAVEEFLLRAKQAPYSKTTIDELITGIASGAFDGMDEFKVLDRMEAFTSPATARKVFGGR